MGAPAVLKGLCRQIISGLALGHTDQLHEVTDGQSKPGLAELLVQGFELRGRVARLFRRHRSKLLGLIPIDSVLFSVFLDLAGS